MPTLEEVSIPGPAGKLEVVVHIPDVAPRAIAVIAHPLPTVGGTMENKIVTTLAKTFAELGFAALRFNFRGVGASNGEFDNGNGEVDDALTVTRYALSKYGDLPLILSGFSFGGYVQARAAQQLPPRQLVLIAPAVMRYAMPPVPRNTLLVHGELDEVVSLTDVMQWARPQLLPIVVLPGAVHFFHGRLDQLKEIVRQNFLGQAL
ncbi:alpha/beta hydrolase [Candidatus Nitrotoga arctica]|uniref:Hydrolase_4 domain-containing protein n=1 Tax=Candidatus Nitrotoga arctica TaxID=453162 RepID=A0ABM8Z3A0_9PROT|nr:alpha/beta fold hydrolase [Candidatus Nitrotoga arctica]CAG9934279.1 Hydrolase_4 domain-containing protein [Candidatus Nitrotoga arctica]